MHQLLSLGATLDELLEPEQKGLVITTARDRYGHSGKAFIWYVDRPRTIYHGYMLHHPISHQGELVALQGPDRLDGIFSAEQKVISTQGGVLYDEPLRVSRMISIQDREL